MADEIKTSAPRDYAEPGTDDARSTETEATNQDRAGSASAAAHAVRKAVAATEQRSGLSPLERDLALIAAAGFIGFMLAGLARKPERKGTLWSRRY